MALTKTFFRENGKRGGEARAKKLSKAQRIAIARKAGLANGKKHRAGKK